MREYLEEDADNSQPVLLHDSLFKQVILLRVPVDDVELGTDGSHIIITRIDMKKYKYMYTASSLWALRNTALTVHPSGTGN